MKTFWKYLPLLLTLLIGTGFISFFPHFGNSLYVLYFVIFLLCLSKGGIKANGLPFVFLGICVLSIWVNDIHSFFNPWERLALFIFVGFLFGPFIENPILIKLRKQVFFLLGWMFAGVAVLSGLGKMAGFSLIKFDNFVGYTGHSAILGAVAGQGVLFILFIISYYLREDSNRKLDKKKLYAALFLCFLMLLGAASRTAILACFVSVFVFLYFAYKQHRQKLYKGVLCVVLLLVVSFPLWNEYTEKLVYKNGGNLSVLNTESRAPLWERALEIFQDSPFTGIGFCVTATRLDPGESSASYEVGNSYLGLLMMLGILGGIPFFWMLIKAFACIPRLYPLDIVRFSYVGGVLTFYCVHMMGEGYALSGGNLCFLGLWLTLGTIRAYRVNPQLNSPYAFTLEAGQVQKSVSMAKGLLRR